MTFAETPVAAAGAVGTDAAQNSLIVAGDCAFNVGGTAVA